MYCKGQEEGGTEKSNVEIESCTLNVSELAQV